MKNIIPLLIYLFAGLTISSCNSTTEEANQWKTKNKEQKSIPVQIQQPKNRPTLFKLSLDDFKGIPEEVDGCSCYFSETDQKFENKEYLFAAGFDSIGFISVDNKLIKLKLILTGREPNTFGDNDHIDVYNSELYKVTVDIKYRNSNGDETWWNDGTITIESKDGQKASKKFVGECGC